MEHAAPRDSVHAADLDEAEDINDSDSIYATEIASSTQSLNAAVLRSEYESGRRYHAIHTSQYAFPNDDEELDRMDFENEIFSMLLGGKPHWAPLETPQRMLDLGTGTGIWAVEIADLYPSESVIGTDLKPSQPSWVPLNLQFDIDDFEQDWTFQKDSFDFIPWRLLLASVSDYPKLFRQAFEHLKPNGYLETHELDPGHYCYDVTLPKDSRPVQWSERFREGVAKTGQAIPDITKYKELMKNAGFVDVEETVLRRPSNTWPKDKTLKRIGLYTLRITRGPLRLHDRLLSLLVY